MMCGQEFTSRSTVVPIMVGLSASNRSSAAVVGARRDLLALHKLYSGCGLRRQAMKRIVVTSPESSLAGTLSNR